MSASAGEIAAALDRAASALPDHEQPPSLLHSEAAALAAAHAREARAFRRSMDARLESLNRLERSVWAILALSLLAGATVAGIVHTRAAPAPPAKFLPEQP